MSKKQKRMLARILIAAACTGVLAVVRIEGWPRLACFIAVYLLIGYDIILKALKGIRNGRVFDENFLMTLATFGAFALAIYERSGDYLEAIAVMLFYQIGEFFQSYAVGRSRQSISELMDIRPDYANIEVNGKIVRTDPDEVSIGTEIIVMPGERVPIDGTVIEGCSTLNTAALTGESLPREINPGEEIVSGCINMTGELRVRTTKEFGESTVSKILELVEDSATHKAASEDFIAKFARVYTPIVCYSALALAVIPVLVRLIAGMPPQWDIWIYRALVFLVISCPCALVVSIPLSFFAGIGGASRDGILVKGANLMEVLSKVRTVVMDKTGTLTLGVFEVNGIHDNEDDENRDEEQRAYLIETAALAECSSTHPISKSLRKAYGKELDHSRVKDIREIGGEGVTAVIDGKRVAVGNEKLMREGGVEPCHCHSAGTIIHVAVDGKYAGHIVMGDVEKPHSKEAIQALKDAGVNRTVMLTGDADPVARQVADSLRIDSVHSELMPEDKVKIVEELLKNQSDKGKLAFVGDGINDAPVLMRADIGIAMGAMGSDAAIEAADIVLMDDDPLKIPKAIRIARYTLGIVWQNIIFAIGIKVACLILGALGIANMWLAIFADVGVLILCVLNSIRAMHVKRK